MCSNIPASPAYGVYISQLIRYARVSSNYSDFLKRRLHLRNRLLDQGYLNVKNTFTSHIDKKIFLTFLLTPYLYTFSLYENASLIIFSAETEYISTRYWYRNINFSNMCSNIPASPAYGVYISQLIRYARASSNYSDFLKRRLHLRNRLLDQGYTLRFKGSGCHCNSI
jgi:hypothetical protein